MLLPPKDDRYDEQMTPSVHRILRFLLFTTVVCLIELPIIWFTLGIKTSSTCGLIKDGGIS